MSNDDQSRLRHNRDYLWLTVGETASTFGTAAASFVLPLVVLMKTDSTVQASMVLAAASLGHLLAAVVVGSWVDQRSRRAAMLVSLWGRLALWLGMAVVLEFDTFWWELFALCGFASGVLAALYQSAEAGALKLIVPPGRLPTAVSVIEGRQAAASLGGAPLGAALMRFGLAVPFWANALSYAASIVGISRIRTPLGRPVSRQPTRRLLAATLDGFRYIRARAGFRTLLLSSSLLNFATNAFTIALILILQRQGEPVWVIALVQTAVGLSLLVGSLVGPTFVRMFPVGMLVVASPLLRLASLLSATLLLQHTAFMLVAVSLAYLMAPASNSAWMSYVAVSTPSEYQGRVAGAEEFASSILIPVSTVFAGAVTSYLSPQPALTVIAGILFFPILLLVADREVRDLPKVATVRAM